MDLSGTWRATVANDDIRGWMEESGRLSGYVHTLGRSEVSTDYLTDILGLPEHLELVVRRLVEEGADRDQLLGVVEQLEGLFDQQEES